MRILIYGFKPYGRFKSNISGQIIASLPESDGVYKKIFDVKFDAGMFNETLEKVRPNIILGLGQHPRARKLRIEHKANNLRMSTSGTERLISKPGPSARFANLPLPRTDLTTLAYDAGTYVCNFSMYLMGEYSEKSGSSFGFLHVPVDFEVALAHGYINKVLWGLR